jgi:cell division septal protein FtsQ
MWFKPARRNRRRSPGEVLQVKLRAGEVRDARVQLAIRAVAVGLGTVFGLYVLWRAGEWGLDKFVYENPAFAIAQVDIQTDGMIAPQQLRRWSGVEPGANLIGVDLAGVKRNLELVSTIDSVSIERILPRTLKIRVTERRPVAQADLLRSLPSGDVVAAVFQLDGQGFVMQPLDPRLSVLPLSQLNDRLPVINGLNPSQLQPGHRLESAQALAALRLVTAFNRSPMAGLAELQSVDISEPGVIEVTTGRGGVITFSPDRLEQQLERWRLIYDWGRRAGKDVASLDLAVGNNVPVKWTVAEISPAVTPKSAKTLYLRRKNV